MGCFSYICPKCDAKACKAVHRFEKKQNEQECCEEGGQFCYLPEVVMVTLPMEDQPNCDQDQWRMYIASHPQYDASQNRLVLHGQYDEYGGVDLEDDKHFATFKKGRSEKPKVVFLSQDSDSGHYKKNQVTILVDIYCLDCWDPSAYAKVLDHKLMQAKQNSGMLDDVRVDVSLIVAEIAKLSRQDMERDLAIVHAMKHVVETTESSDASLFGHVSALVSEYDNGALPRTSGNVEVREMWQQQLQKKFLHD